MAMTTGTEAWRSYTILQAMRHRKLFGRFFRDSSWDAWRVVLAGIFGLGMSPDELQFFTTYSGRTVVPAKQFLEAWLINGRRAGKSIISSLVGSYMATFVDYRPFLKPGERATVMILASDKRQAGNVMDYCVGFFENIPVLKQLVLGTTVDTISLKGQVEISIHTSSFKAVRGYSVPVLIGDEIAFWQDANSANPASEVLAAVRPSMAQFPHPLLLAFSSPYARRGVLWEARRDFYGRDDADVLVWQAPSIVMNSTLTTDIIDRARKRDPVGARSEWDAEFRNDVDALFGLEAIAAVTVRERTELAPAFGTTYRAFVDPSGGSSDSMTLAIAHKSWSGAGVLDCIREVRPPFSPEAVCEEFAGVLKRYKISEVYGDRYAGEWPREQFQKRGIMYRLAESSKSEIYLQSIALVMSRRVELLDQPRLLTQLTDLERSTRSGGRDAVDHQAGGHDDVANCACGALVLVVGGQGRIELTWANKVVELVEKYGDAWRDFIGKDDVPTQAPTLPANARDGSEQNMSVLKARAAQEVTATCPACGGSTCIVRRGPLYLHNSCGHEWRAVPAEEPVGQRRAALAKERRR